MSKFFRDSSENDNTPIFLPFFSTLFLFQQNSLFHATFAVSRNSTIHYIFDVIPHFTISHEKKTVFSKQNNRYG